jgi:threonyl-tRNA synthetase
MIPVGERHQGYAREVAEKLRARGLRVHVDERSEKMGYRIREAQVQKVPYMLVVGDKEVAARNLSVRHRQAGDLGPAEVEAFGTRIARLAAERAIQEESAPSSGGVS